MRDESAHRNAREHVEQREHRIPDVAADILEIDIDAFRHRGTQLLGEIRRTMIETDVEAELFPDIAHLLRAASDPDDTAPFQLRDLPDHGADRPAGRSEERRV